MPWCADDKLTSVRYEIEGPGGQLGETRTHRRRVDGLRVGWRLPEPVRLDRHTDGRMGAPLHAGLGRRPGAGAVPASPRLDLQPVRGSGVAGPHRDPGR